MQLVIIILAKCNVDAYMHMGLDLIVHLSSNMVMAEFHMQNILFQ
jgi:hypothetical protein